MSKLTVTQKLYYYRDQVLLEKIDNSYKIPELTTTPSWLTEGKTIYPVGTHFDISFEVVEVVEPDQLSEPYVWLSLRASLEALYPQAFSLLVRAHQILTWDRNHRYCGRCGVETRANQMRFERQCPSCHLLFYPRISPSIIVAITKGDEILLARQASFAAGVYALIAGFVEVGETLEQTVEREVFEEVGLTVKNIRYVDSQPWPFPDSLMIGFTAEYAGGEITLRDGELEKAGWYGVDNLPGLPSSSISISLKLINDFIAKVKSNH